MFRLMLNGPEEYQVRSLPARLVDRPCRESYHLEVI